MVRQSFEEFKPKLRYSTKYQTFVTDAPFYPAYLFFRMPCYMHQHSLCNDHVSLATVNSACKKMNYNPRYVHVSTF